MKGSIKTISFVTQAMLREPYDGMPSPLDQACPWGGVTLASLLFGYQAMPAKVALKLRRRDFAVTPDEVERLLRSHDRFIQQADMPLLKDRVFVLHRRGVMPMVDRHGYARPLPCHRSTEAAIRKYFDQHELWDADPEVYVFAKPESDRSTPPLTGLYFHPGSYRGGVVRLDEDGLPLKNYQGGFFPRAFDTLRRRLLEEGRDWSEHAPLNEGTRMFPMTTNLIRAWNDRGWRRERGFGEYLNYLLNQRIPGTRTGDEFLLNPALLLAIVDLQDAPEVGAETENSPSLAKAE